MKRILLLCLVAGLMAACSHKYATDAIQPPQQRLDRAASIYVMMPENGSYGGTRYAGSGRHVSLVAFSALSKYTAKVSAGETPETLAGARAKAEAAGVAYILEPTILNWEDRATEWSGRPDRITIKLVLWDAKTGLELASSLARASSKWATFGGDHPQDLLPVLMANFVDRLY
ncbi:MAG: DUF4823 domain-containing protein [Rhodospirillales bacterium]|nr:DUF4823 domain-containing protein [Rhodospirillales bacterium]